MEVTAAVMVVAAVSEAMVVAVKVVVRVVVPVVAKVVVARVEAVLGGGVLAEVRAVAAEVATRTDQSRQP